MAGLAVGVQIALGLILDVVGGRRLPLLADCTDLREFADTGWTGVQDFHFCN